MMQPPLTIGIVLLNMTMFATGIPLAIGMLAVNMGVVVQPRELRRLLAPSAG